MESHQLDLIVILRHGIEVRHKRYLLQELAEPCLLIILCEFHHLVAEFIDILKSSHGLLCVLCYEL